MPYLLFQGQFDSINFAPMPDGNLNYNDILDAALKVCYPLFNVYDASGSVILNA